MFKELGICFLAIILYLVFLAFLGFLSCCILNVYNYIKTNDRILYNEKKKEYQSKEITKKKS